MHLAPARSDQDWRVSFFESSMPVFCAKSTTEVVV